MNQDSMDIIKANQNLEAWQKKIFELEAARNEAEKIVKDWEEWASMTCKEFKNYNDLRKENKELSNRLANYWEKRTADDFVLLLCDLMARNELSVVIEHHDREKIAAALIKLLQEGK